MKFCIAVFAIVLASMAATAFPSQAQTAWSTWNATGSSCVLQSDSVSLAYQSAVYGSVSFLSNKSGDIKLTCPVPFTRSSIQNNGLDWPDLHITYDNGSGGGCYVWADLLYGRVDSQFFGGDLGWIRADAATSGKATASTGLSGSMDFTQYYYWIDVQLHRDTPTTNCNPNFMGAYLTPQQIQ